MRRKLYELALWYIGKCNKKWDSSGTKERVEKLKRLTYRSGTDNKACLVYGAAHEWEKCTRYCVIDNAIQRLAAYEDATGLKNDN